MVSDIPSNVIPDYELDPEKWNTVQRDLANMQLTGPYGADGLSDLAKLLLDRIGELTLA